MNENPEKIASLGNTLTLVEFAQLLWKKKLLIALFVLLTTVLGAFYAMWVRPQFTSDALLQVNVKGTSSKATKAFGEMGAVLDLASPASLRRSVFI